jgi:hypothetical protein
MAPEVKWKAGTKPFMLMEMEDVNRSLFHGIAPQLYFDLS